MDVVILCAGRGDRMYPFSVTRPKCLLPFGPECSLSRLFRQLALLPVSHLRVVTDAQDEMMREAARTFGGKVDVPLSFIAQGGATGTLGALRAGWDPASPWSLVVNGDCWFEEGFLSRLATATRPTIAGTQVADRRGYGAMTVVDGVLDSIVEKPTTPGRGMANAGAYLLPADFVEALLFRTRVSETVDLVGAFSMLAPEWELHVLELERWADLAWPWDLLTAARLSLDEQPAQFDGEVAPTAIVDRRAHVARTAVVLAGSIVEGPAYIGPGSVIGPNAYVRAGAVLVRDVKIGFCSEVKASLLMEGARLSHMCYVGDSVLGRHVALGAQSVIANRRLDGQEVRSFARSRWVSTGRRKMGAAVGDNSSLAIHSSINSGVLLPPFFTTRPGEVVMRSPATPPSQPPT